MDERRVADYFIVAGLPEIPLPLEEYANEAVIKPTYKQDPITDISVINKTLGEKVPKGFTCLERTTDGFPADLNHGSLRCAEMYLCFRRSRDKTPLTDVGVLFEGKERLMSECEVVHTTPFGSPANVNNSSNGRTYITYRRAKETAASDTLAVVDICVILTNKGEIPPHAYHRIEKNLNRGMVGSDVFICYKKAMTKMDVLAYQPAYLDRYPREDYLSFPLPDSVPLFCLPMGASIECWSAKAQHPLPVFSTFVLTGSAGEQLYGAAVTFYEEFPEERLTDLQKRHLGLKNKHIREQYRILKTVHAHKSICLLSHWPFFDAFRKFLTYLYRISITGPHSVPLERHISHFMYDVPYPSPQRPRILVQLNHEALCLSMPEDSPLPQTGASYITMLKNLGPENCMNLLLHILLEQKILLHSLRPAVLTGVAESVANMLFPLHWQCAYIPLCPLGLSYVLSAPVPFIVGVDTRYFDLYDPPPEVICVDLDTIAIFLPDDKKNVTYKQFPKKAAKVLYNTLHRLFDELCAQRSHTHSIDEISLEMAPIDHDFKRKRKETLMELQIQEAFLRFMACILKGYKQFLKPITHAPTQSTTDTTSLFDMQGFLKSRDKANMKFYGQLTKTQTFIRFIEERSFVSDKDASLAFFDECTEKVDETKEEPKLIEIDDSQNSERTVFILPPEPVGLPEGVKYSYNGFPELKHELFMKKNVSELSLPTKGPVCPNSPISRRTKQEVRTAQKNAVQNSTDPMLWAKCLLSHCYSLWFIHLPAYVAASPSKKKALKAAYDVLQKMKLAKLQPPDEVCYRVMLQLCGQYNMPVLAVKVHSQMKMAGVHPNAITYGYYNKAVFEGTWPSSRSRGAVLWKKVRNVIFGVAQFRRAIRRRSMSLCSNSGSDYDQISRTSIDSFLEDPGEKPQSIIKSDIVVTDTGSTVSEAPTSTISEESATSEMVSDRGYNSMTYDEAKTIVQSVTEMTIQEEEETGKVRKETKPSLRFSLPRKHNSARTSGKKDIDFPACDADPVAFRSRVGSIVRKSLGSIGSIGSHETLKGSLMSLSSTGLIMVNENIKPSEFQRQISLDNNNGKRKRHKSAGDYNKPRSQSVSENWRPRHVSGEDRLFLKFNELERKGSDDDIFEVELDKPEDSVLSDEMRTSDDTKDSGVVLDECRVQGSDNTDTRTSSARPMSIPIDMKPSSMSNSVSAPETLDPSPVLHSIGTPVTTNDPLGLFMDGNSNIPVSDSVSKFSSETNVTFSHCVSQPYEICSQPESSDQFDFNEPVSNSGVAAQECNISEARRTRSNSDNKNAFSLGSAQSLDAVSVTSTGSQPLSPVGKIGKRLMDIGRTNSSPGSLDNTEKTGRGFWPVKGYLQSLSSSLKKSTDSLDEKEESSQATTPDSHGPRKVGSFRKHNERLSGALKMGFGALANKFSEIKQTMSTPTKTGSNTSLSHTGDCDSVNSEEGNPHHKGALDVPARKSAMGSDRDLRRGDARDESKDTATALPVGSFLPSSSFMEQYIPLKEFGEQKSVHFASLAPSLNDIAIETEISSCCRCTRCKSLLYDEEIMSGWLADDSNLNTICVFCQTKIVPRLQIYVKDWRDHCHNTHIEGLDVIDLADKVEEHSLQVEDHDRDSVSENSTNDPWVLQDNTSVGSIDNNHFFFPGEESLDGDGHASPVQSHRSARKDAHLAEAARCSSPSGTSGSSEFDVTAGRRRCTSECLTSATDMMFGTSFDSMDNFQSQFVRSPLNISIEEDNELPTRPSDLPEMKKDFMERGTTSMDPITVPYLSPLVLRKELENILNSEGDMSLSVDVFLDEHPIIFWNLVWYFKRIEVPSHMPGLLLTAKYSNPKPTKSTAVYTSQHVLIRPLWDNIRIHDEVGLPMYKLWNEGHSSHTVDALITEQQPFNRATLHQIITSVQCNDVLSPIKMIGNCRRRHRLRRPKYRSLYRDMLFLAFTACGRENIDHDAFDREYRQAFNRLLPMEVKRLQRNDRPRKTKVIWCRKVFGELEV
ncbi:C-myc promoter-binding protein-like [Pecten maximus]|uniref:C-myc promoter-binding protein-like n=1 Tax=Pecten maximus TaxID=6579 RepID=UPI00145823C9|nr:C-myc promoter-binding protein-like [Pecten maximus]